MCEMKEFIYVLRPARLGMIKDGHTPEEDRVIEEHVAYLKGLASDGTVVLAGPTLNEDESTFGIVVFHATSEEKARSVMEDDPAVRQNHSDAGLGCLPRAARKAGPEQRSRGAAHQRRLEELPSTRLATHPHISLPVAAHRR